MKAKTDLLSEKEIITLLKNRDLRGIDALYYKYNEYIYSLIFEIVKIEALSETILQDAFLKVWHTIDRYACNKGRFLSWFADMARRIAQRVLESKHRKLATGYMVCS